MNMTPPPLPPQPPPLPPSFEPPPEPQSTAARWLIWVIMSILPPATGFITDKFDLVMAFAGLGALTGLLASLWLASAMAPPSKVPGKWLGLTCLFWMGSCGIILATIFVGCLAAA